MNHSLKQIELEVLALHNSMPVRTTIDQAKRIGKLLMAAKAQLPHGGYIPWLMAMGLNRKTAHDYVMIAKAPNVRSAGHLGIGTVLTQLRAGRKAERQEQANELAMSLPATSMERKIITADSLTWMGKQKAGSIPFVVSDPPYGLGLTYDGWTETDTADGYWQWFQPFWEEMKRILVPGGSILLWQSYKRFSFLENWFPSAKIIANCQMMGGRRFFEPIVFWTKPGMPLVRHQEPNDWFLGSQGGKAHDPYARLHPCVKPVDDCRVVIRRFTIAGSLLLDPFTGTGSICQGALLENRDFLGVEQSELFANLARQRVQDSGNKKR